MLARRGLSELLALNKRLFTVYVLKDDLKRLWRYHSPYYALKFFKGWYRRAIYSKIELLKKFARKLKRRLHGILAPLPLSHPYRGAGGHQLTFPALPLSFARNYRIATSTFL